jgi:hypothetical protein
MVVEAIDISWADNFLPMTSCIVDSAAIYMFMVVKIWNTIWPLPPLRWQPLQMGHSLHIKGRGGGDLDNLLMSMGEAWNCSVQCRTQYSTKIMTRDVNYQPVRFGFVILQYLTSLGKRTFQIDSDIFLNTYWRLWRFWTESLSKKPWLFEGKTNGFVLMLSF